MKKAQKGKNGGNRKNPVAADFSLRKERNNSNCENQKK